MSDPERWQKALERLLVAPMVSAAQARHLFGTLSAPREAAVEMLLARLGDANLDNARDAAFLLEHVLTGADKAQLVAFVGGKAPLATRAWARSLYQNGLAHGRISDEDADLPVPASDVVPLFVEDVVRHVKRIPQPWQRARVAAESLVSDTPLPDDAVVAAVTSLATRLSVPAAHVWAELLIHPLTRDSYRAAASEALKTPAQSVVPMLELADGALLPGKHRDNATRTLEAARQAATGTTVGVLVSPADPRGAVVGVLHVEGATPLAVSWVAWPGLQDGQWKFAQGLEAEGVHLWAAGMAAEQGGLRSVEPAAGLGMLCAATAWLWDDTLLGKGKDGPRPLPSLREAIERVAKAGGLTVPGVVPALPAAGAWDASTLDGANVNAVELQGGDLGDSARKELSKELRARGRPKDETVALVAKELAQKKAAVARVRGALEHGARLAALCGDSDGAGKAAGMALALAEPGSAPAQKAMAAVLRKTLGPPEVPASMQPVVLARDELRDDVLPHNGPPKGLHVLALDLAGAALDAGRATPKALDGLSDDEAVALCADAGLMAARAVVDGSKGGTEETRLQDAAKNAIKEHAPELPSRQRRDLTDAWLKAWPELLTRACRGTCSQQCLAHLQEPRVDAAYALEHPRHNKPWP